MTKLTQLRAAREVGAPEWREQRGVLAAVLHVSTSKGDERALTHVQLQSGGLKIFRGDAVVGIEIDELIRLAVEHEPALAGVDLPEKAKV